MAGVSKEIEAAARTLGLQLQLVPAFGPDDLIGAFAAISKARADALIVMPSPMLFGEYKRIAALRRTADCRQWAQPGNLWRSEDSCPTA
jgi:hypothetical protein